MASKDKKESGYKPRVKVDEDFIRYLTSGFISLLRGYISSKNQGRVEAAADEKHLQ